MHPTKRRKVSRACDVCKRRKAKCSGTMPCDSCIAKGISCLYEAVYARGRPPTPLMYNPEQIHSSPAVSTNRDGSESVQLQTEERDGNSEQDLTAASPELELTEVEGQYVEPVSGLAFLHRAWKRLSRHGPHQTSISGQAIDCEDESVTQKQDWAGDKPLETPTHGNGPTNHLNVPDRETSNQLLAFYFDVCIVTYRFLHKPTVYKWLDQVLHNAEYVLPLSNGIGEMRASIVLTALAIATFHRAKSGERTSFGAPILTSRHADHLFVAATQLSDHATGYPTIESVQAKLIHTLYLLHSSRMNRAWYVFGGVIQTIAALGIHRKTSCVRSMDKSAVVDYVLLQCHRRCFWVAYTLDTYLGVILGRPRHYHDESISQDFPDSVNDEDMTSTGPKVTSERYKESETHSLIYHAKIAKIVAKTSRQVYGLSPPSSTSLAMFTKEICQEIQSCEANLTPILGSVRPSSLIPPFRRQATALRLAFCHAMLHATRPFLLKSPSSDTMQVQAIQHCLAAAQDVLEIVDELAQGGTLFHAFWWTHYVLFCSLTVVYIWKIQYRTSADSSWRPKSPVSNNKLSQLAARCQQYLADATAASAPSRRYSIILEELQQEAAESHTQGRKHTRGHSHTEVSEHGLTAEIMGRMVVPGINNTFTGFLDSNTGWQNINWLDIDSLAFGPLPVSLEQYQTFAFATP